MSLHEQRDVPPPGTPHCECLLFNELIEKCTHESMINARLVWRSECRRAQEPRQSTVMGLLTQVTFQVSGSAASFQGDPRRH